MTILLVAYPFAPVSFDTPGGSEQIVAALDRELTRAGHRSLVLAQVGSSVEGVLLPVPRINGLIGDAERQRARAAHAEAITWALQEFAIDAVHMHGLDFPHYLPEGDVPVLATLHLPASFYAAGAFELQRKNTWMNCVSRSQQSSMPPSLKLLPPVSNGIALDLISPEPAGAREYCLMLTRICPEKGVHLGIEAARRSGCELVIAGEVFPYPEHQAYFEREIRPVLGRGVKFVGRANMDQKRRLLTGARCVLLPSVVDETSSLVAMEAAACGTPAIAFNRGALPEIIEDGRSGLIVSDVTGMSKAIEAATRIDAESCRTIARNRFNAHRMMRTYAEYYRVITSRRNIPAHGGWS